MLSDAEEWGLLSIADVLEGKVPAEATDKTTSAYPATDPFFALDVTDCTPEVAHFAHKLMASLVAESAAYTTSIEETFATRSQRVRHSLGASRRIRDKLLAAVDTFRSSAPAASQTLSALGTIAILGAALGGDDAAYNEAVLLSISMIDWKLASPSSSLEILESFKLDETRCTYETKQRIVAAKLCLSLQSGSLSALIACMLSPGAQSVQLPPFSAPLPSTTGPLRASACRYAYNETSIENFLLRHCSMPVALEKATLGCFPLVTSPSSPFPSSSAAADTVMRSSSGTDCLAVVNGEHLALFEVAGMMGTRYRKLRNYLLPLQPGEQVVSCTDTHIVTVQRVGRVDGRARYVVQELTLPAKSLAETPRKGVSRAASISDEYTCRRGCLVLNAEGLGVVASGRCLFSCFPTPESDEQVSSAAHGGARSTLGGGTRMSLALLLCSQSQNVSRRRLYAAVVGLEDVLASTGEVEVAFTGASSTLLRNPAGAARPGKALYFTKNASISVGSVTLKEHFHPFCVELWVYPRNAVETQSVISFGDKSTDEVLIELDPSSDGIIWRGGARTPQLGSSFASYSLPGKLSVTERWWHVALNFTGAAWELWLDFRLVATQPALVSPEAIRGVRCDLAKNFVGFLAEVRVWSRTRTAAELVRDSCRSLSGAEEALMGYYPLDERHGSVIADYAAAGQHTLIWGGSHGGSTGSSPRTQLNWCAVPSFPVAPPEEPRLVPDFAPLTCTEEVGSVRFCASPRHLTVTVNARVGGEPVLFLYQYDRETLVLSAQTVLELPAGAGELQVCGACYDCARSSTLCYGLRKGRPDQVVLWDVHEPGGIDLAPVAHRLYTSAWDCGRDVLVQSAAYAQRYTRSETYLLDESAWAVPVPALVADLDPRTVPSLHRLATVATAMADTDALIDAASVLLRANLLLRQERSGGTVTAELGPPFPTAEALLAVVQPQPAGHAPPAASSSSSSNGMGMGSGAAPFALRDGLVRLAFHPAAERSGLLETLCQSLLTEEGRTMFVKSVAGQSRGPREERLLACVLDHYGTLRASTEVLESPRLAQHLYTSLLLEATYQVERSTRNTSLLPLRRTSRCLEVLQEILFTKASEGVGAGASREQVNFCVSYAKTLLRACEKTIDAVVKAARRHGDSLGMLMQCLELSPVGALLPSFTVSLPFLPAIVLVTCAAPMQACRGALSALAEETRGAGAPVPPGPATVVSATAPSPLQARWVAELGVALTFSLCLAGCSLLNAAPPFAPAPDTSGGVAPSSDEGAAVSERQLGLLRSGQRRAGTERDTLLRNLQQGVGVVSKSFEQLQRGDPTGLVVARDEALRRMERTVMMAYCALLLPTSALREATPESLRPAYTHVQRLRPWVLSRRQESRECVQLVERRATFLAQFECCVPGQAAEQEQALRQQQQQQQQRHQHQHQRGGAGSLVVGTAGGKHRRAAVEASSRHQWRKLFRGWKRLRLLATLLSAQEEADGGSLAADITTFLQSDADLTALERAVAWRAEKARYRLSGLLLLCQLVGEARVSAPLAQVILPAIAKAMCGWHYAVGVEGCTGEEMFRLQGAFFQLFDAVLSTFLLDAGDGNAPVADGPARRPWAVLLTALMTAVSRMADFRKVRGELCRAVRRLLRGRGGYRSFQRRLGGSLPPLLRGTRLAAGLAAPTMTIGASGLTLKITGGRGTCIAPCSWLASHPQHTYYMEVTIVDACPGAAACIGLGAMDYSLSRTPGIDTGSVGLHGDEGVLFTGSSTGRATGFGFGSGDVVGCGWDPAGRLVYWTRNGRRIADTELGADRLSPLIGFEGRGLLRVNFGAEPFVFDGAADGVWGGAGGVVGGGGGRGPRMAARFASVHGVWDAFRIFTVRAALALAQACVRGSTAPASVAELAGCLRHSLTALGEELREAYAGVVAGFERRGGTTDVDDSVDSDDAGATRYLAALLPHCSTLAQLLVGVPRDVAAPCAAGLAAALQTVVVGVLRMGPTPRGSGEGGVGGALSCSRGGGAALVTAALTAFYHVMALVPPTPREDWRLLPLLLHLASRLVAGGRGSSAAARVQPSTSAAEESWMALALLQQLNRAAGRHACHDSLHEWLLATLARGTSRSSICNSSSGGGAAAAAAAGGGGGGGLTTLTPTITGSTSRDLALALAILGGSSRLAAPGDRVTVVPGGRHSATTATLVSYNLAEELCEVVLDGDGSGSGSGSGVGEGAARQRRRRLLPLRAVDLVLSDDSDHYFPAAGDHPAHAAQARQVLAVALRTLTAARLTAAPVVREIPLWAPLVSILSRCAARGVLELPAELVDPLCACCDPADGAVRVDVHQLRAERVLCEDYGVAHRQTSSVAGGAPTATETGAVDSPLTSLAAQLGVARPAPGVGGGFDALLSTTVASLDGGESFDDGYDGAAAGLEDGTGGGVLYLVGPTATRVYHSGGGRVDDGDDSDEDVGEEDVGEEEDGAEGAVFTREGAYSDGGEEELSEEGSGEEGDPYGLDGGDYGDEDDEEEDGYGLPDDLGHSASVGLSSISDVVGRMPREGTEDSTLAALSESYDTIRFDHGHLRITANRAISLNFTLDLQLRLRDVVRSQVILYHAFGTPASPLVGRAALPTPAPPTRALIARAGGGRVEFGVVDCASLAEGVQSGTSGTDADADLCRCPLGPEDTERWVRLTFVQSGAMLSLYRDGVLRDTRRARRGTGQLFQEDLFIGGAPLDVGVGGLAGDVKALRVYEVALRPAMIEQLHALSSSLSIFVESHQCLQLRVRRDCFDNYSRSPSALLIACLTEGHVGYLEDAPVSRTRGEQGCMIEFDFTNTADQLELFSLDVPTAADPSANLAAMWRRKQEAPPTHVLLAHARCYRGLLSHASAGVLVEMLAQRSDAFMGWLARAGDGGGGLVRRLVGFALAASSDELSARLEVALCGLVTWALAAPPATSGATPPSTTTTTHQTAASGLPAVVLGAACEAVRGLLQAMERPQRMRVFESTHPVRAVAGRSVHEVHVPGAGYYEFFFDPRSLGSGTLLTFAVDHALTNVLIQCASYTLTPFSARLRRVYIGARNTAASPQWGYKIIVVFDCKAQRRATRLLRTILSAVLDAAPLAGVSQRHRLPALWTRDCIEQLCKCVRINTGKTRRLALSCLTDLLSHPQEFQQPLRIPMRVMHDIRRMAERQLRRYTGPDQRQLTLHSRFVQVVTEAYVAFTDALHSTSSLPGRPTAHGPAWRHPHPLPPPPAAESVDPTEEREAFAQRRLEQRALYRLRDGSMAGRAGDRVSLQRAPDAGHVHLEWDADHTCLARHEGGRGAGARPGSMAGASTASLVAQVALTAGRWYFELRVGGTGDFFVGVVPSPVGAHDARGAPVVRGEPLAYNGFTGLQQGAGGAVRRLTAGETWRPRDYIGVVLDVDGRRCEFYVNGQATNVELPLGEDDDDRAAAAAAAVAHRLRPSPSGGGGGASGLGSSSSGGGGGGGEDELPVTAYFPFFALEPGETLYLNFGAAHFEFEPPKGCLPLDPTSLMLSSVLPYNPLRAFQDLSAHLLSSGRHPLPPFYYDEADPFAESTVRSGPAHVSLHAAEGVQVSLLDVKNNGTRFQTVRADCAVSGGCWYYEVTLRTQGLMQLGWIARRRRAPGAGAATTDDETDNSSVGDTETSWAIDLFRRLRWHGAAGEPVTVQRRWAVGDVVGCALDLDRGEMTFSFNGRPILGSVAGSAGASLPPLGATFSGLPTSAGLEFVPAVSLRSGNQVSFNFGSSPFKHKPEGFRALGVPDSWTERMDAFYANERPAVTAARLRALDPLCMEGGPASYAVTARWATALAPYRVLVEAADRFCEETGMNYTQLAEADLQTYVQRDGSAGAVPSGTEHDPVTGRTRQWEMFHILLAVARVAQTVVPFISPNTQHPSMTTRLLLAMRGVLLRQQRVALVDALVRESNVRTEPVRISINRLRARQAGRCLDNTIFGQTFSLMGAQQPRMFQTNKRFWSTVFLGEGAEDAGGPYREHISEMCRELMSADLPFFVPTANHTHNTGTHRDAFVPAPGASSPRDLAVFRFIGELMGGAVRSEEPLSLFLPPLVWKYLCYHPVTEADLGDIDAICLHCIREFRELQAQPGESDAEQQQEAFEEVFDNLYFATKLSDGTTRELIPGGAAIRVTRARCAEYAEALLEARLHEADAQLRKMREGMLAVLPEMVLLLLTPRELELRVCGQADYAVEDLKKGVIYEGLTSEDRRVQLLWRALEEATPLQRRLFLRFVSGRDRMPVKLRILPLTPPSQAPGTTGGSAGGAPPPAQQQAEADLMLPRAATCFFAIEVPDYSTLAIMKDKLFYSIENCASMDTDFNARPTDENEGPHLVVGMEDHVRSSDVGTGGGGGGGGAGGSADE